MRAYMLTIRDACRRPFATISIVMVANGRRQSGKTSERGSVVNKEVGTKRTSARINGRIIKSNVTKREVTSGSLSCRAGRCGLPLKILLRVWPKFARETKT
jgi:hypothetical protein